MAKREFTARIEIVGQAAPVPGLVRAELTIWAADATEAADLLDEYIRTISAAEPGRPKTEVHDAEWYG